MIGVGDVVVCVDDSRRTEGIPRIGSIKNGSTYRVSAVSVNADWIGIQVDGVDHPPCGFWDIDRFRKVLPADPAFIERIRSLTPHKEHSDA